MWFLSRVALFASAVAAIAASSTTATTPESALVPRSLDTSLKINGWYPCTRSKATATLHTNAFECAQVEMPMCHEGICKSTKTINVFVKRLMPAMTSNGGASAKQQHKRAAMWILQGGPGYSSQAMEGHMLGLNKTMGGTVDLYTLDHRGTGRSHFLDCQAAQAFVPGSAGGVTIEYSEVASCVNDILFQIENKTEAFSVTSAATDVVRLVDALNSANDDVFVYGASYGSYWAARVLHLAPVRVRGYVLDGVVDERSPTFTTWNANKRFAERRFIAQCEASAFCRRKLGPEIKAHGGLAHAWHALYDTLDAAAPGTNACADLVRTFTPVGAKPSHALRNVLGAKAPDVHARLVLPAIVHRLSQCRPHDVSFLRTYFGIQQQQPLHHGSSIEATTTAIANAKAADAFSQVFAASPFLGMLIRASEMWTTPSPSWADELTQFQAGLLSTRMHHTFAMVCLLRTSRRGSDDDLRTDPACANLVATHPELLLASSKRPNRPFVYTPDRYYKQYAAIPAHASVLLFNGGLDFQTEREWGRAEFDGLHGDGAKLLVEFDNGHHCTGLGATTTSDTTQCGYRITASFVRSRGCVDNVDTTCMDALPALDFSDMKAIRRVVNVTTADALYD